ncbi:MAG TPA: hypothetical protein VG345_11615 [Bryobacteraceae bacterium]|jgi:hypothetical protein|nr:hypothetical protein [Bryobacteraceae bacterium]
MLIRYNLRCAPVLYLAAALAPFAFAQPTAPHSNLILLKNIAVPNWTTTGSTQANFDLFTFDGRTQILYFADRTNKSVTVVDAATNQTIGVVPLPSGGSTNGVVVVPDLHKLVVTDGLTNVFVYDLRVPSTPPDTYTVPNITGGTDALDYDPLNRTVYVINGNAPYYETGVDLVNRKIATQFQLPGSPELLRFNSFDGLIYQVITDNDNQNKGAGLYVYDPIGNTITAKYLTPNCVPHGIDIDPVTDVALLGCGTNQAQIAMDLRNGAIIQRFPDVTGTDLLQFNRSTGRFYTASSSNVSTTTGCPADSTGATPVIGIFSSPGPGRAVEDGVQCAGRNSHGLGVDPVDDYLYVGSRQYPVNAASASTGSPGVLVFYDPTARRNVGLPSIVDLSSADGATFGTIQFSLDHGILRAQGTVSSPTATTVLVSVPTTFGNEVVPCSANPMTGTSCSGILSGNPVIGATAIIAVNGAPAATGIIYRDSLAR